MIEFEVKGREASESEIMKIRGSENNVKKVKREGPTTRKLRPSKAGNIPQDYFPAEGWKRLIMTNISCRGLPVNAKQR